MSVARFVSLVLPPFHSLDLVGSLPQAVLDFTFELPCQFSHSPTSAALLSHEHEWVKLMILVDVRFFLFEEGSEGWDQMRLGCRCRTVSILPHFLSAVERRKVTVTLLFLSVEFFPKSERRIESQRASSFDSRVSDSVLCSVDDFVSPRMEEGTWACDRFD